MNTSNKTARFGIVRTAVTAMIIALALCSLVGCGSTSGLQTAQGQAVTSMRKFSKVSVQTFKMTLEGPEENSEGAPRYFANQIVEAIQITGRFASVTKSSKSDASTLVIDGVITSYHEGNPMLRAFIGMGAGGAFFEADVYFRDSQGVVIGKIKVDEKALGGAFSASENPTVFMNTAAMKIAEEAAKLAR